MKNELTLEEAAHHVGITPEELSRSRARGLPPGNLGYTLPPHDGTVYFRAVDLLVDKPHRCDECGFRAKTAGGLASHQRTH